MAMLETAFPNDPEKFPFFIGFLHDLVLHMTIVFYKDHIFQSILLPS